MPSEGSELPSRNTPLRPGRTPGTKKGTELHVDDGWVYTPPTTPMTQATRDAEFQRLYELHHLKVFNYIAKLIGNREDALDILQEVYLLFYDRLPRLDTSTPRIEAWLMRVARNLALTYGRKKSKDVVSEISVNTAATRINTEADLQKREVQKRFDAFMESLTENERTIFILHKLESVKYRDLEKIFGISPRTLKRIVASVVARMKDQDIFAEDDFG